MMTCRSLWSRRCLNTPSPTIGHGTLTPSPLAGEGRGEGASRRALTRFLALVFLALFSSAALAAKPAMHSAATRTEHFLVRHDPRLRATAEVIGDACEGWLDEISRKLDYRDKPESLIPVFLYRDQGEFKQATGLDRPGEVLGRASSHGYVELDISGIFAPAEMVAGHEIVHVVIFRIMGDRSDTLPLWFNEGTAKHLTNDFDQLDRAVLADAASEGTLLPLRSIAHAFPEGSGETLAYAQGASAVTFFAKTEGESSIAKIIHETARTGSFDRAMRKVTGESAEVFERKWRESIEGRYGITKLMQTLGRIGFMAMVIIAVAAYLGIRRRRRRAIERYESEEDV